MRTRTFVINKEKYLFVAEKKVIIELQISSQIYMVLMTTVAAVLLALPLSAVRTVSNAVPRVDTDGNIVDAHSGNIVEMNGTYFLYGEFYGK